MLGKDDERCQASGQQIQESIQKHISAEHALKFIILDWTKPSFPATVDVPEDDVPEEHRFALCGLDAGWAVVSWNMLT